MIPLAYITQWRKFAPWSDDLQIEQDLILSRMIVDIFSNSFLAKELAFRGGTALHKLFFNPSARYSEDIDLVRTGTGAIKNIIDALHDSLNPWLGQPKTARNDMGFKLYYSFTPENNLNYKQKIKIEINIRETFSILDYLEKDFIVDSAWFSGKAVVKTFQLEELIATKLRALYQRKKGRDLFDLWLALKEKDFDVSKTINIFQQYIERQGLIITRKDYEKNLLRKLQENSFVDDIDRLILPSLKETQAKSMVTDVGDFIVTDDGQQITTDGWSLHEAAEEVRDKILIYL